MGQAHHFHGQRRRVSVTIIGFDDAIVEIENIERQLRHGKSPREASLAAADEIGLAVIATSLMLVAVFLPTAFMGGLAGKFFKQFGWTSSIAVLFSLLVARLLTPIMAAVIMKAPPAHAAHETEGPLMQHYLRTVMIALTGLFCDQLRHAGSVHTAVTWP